MQRTSKRDRRLACAEDCHAAGHLMRRSSG